MCNIFSFESVRNKISVTHELFNCLCFYGNRPTKDIKTENGFFGSVNAYTWWFSFGNGKLKEAGKLETWRQGLYNIECVDKDNFLRVQENRIVAEDCRESQ